MNNIKITVVTVTYNAAQLLKNTTANVLSQDYKNLEYIVVDGASKDESLRLLENINDCRFKYISEPDKGIYDAMNKGAQMATGEYCIFMNAGDVFASNDTISKVISCIHKDDDVVYGDILKNNVIKKSLSPRNCHKMYYCHQAVFTKTSCLLEFPFDITHRFSADFKQAKQLFLAGKMFNQLDFPIAVFDTSGISNTQRSRGLWDNITVVWQVDNLAGKTKNLPRLLFTWLLCKLRGK